MLYFLTMTKVHSNASMTKNTMLDNHGLALGGGFFDIPQLGGLAVGKLEGLA